MTPCGVCKVEKPPTEFSIKKSAKSGRNPYCKLCERARVAAYMARQPGFSERKAAYDKARNTAKAEEIRAKARARNRKNSAERCIQARKWAQENPEARRAISLAYKSRRRSACGRGMSGAEMRKWLSDQVMICSYCFRRCQSDFEIDHITPLASGGEHGPDNLTIACPGCNRRKSSKPLLIFLLEREMIA